MRIISFSFGVFEWNGDVCGCFGLLRFLGMDTVVLVGRVRDVEYIVIFERFYLKKNCFLNSFFRIFKY